MLGRRKGRRRPQRFVILGPRPENAEAAMSHTLSTSARAVQMVPSILPCSSG